MRQQSDDASHNKISKDDKQNNKIENPMQWTDKNLNAESDQKIKEKQRSKKTEKNNRHRPLL